MTDNITEEGYENVISVIEDYYNLTVTTQFINENLQLFSHAFPDADDPDYTKKDNGETWWTFVGECNSGGIYDTCRREILSRCMASIFTSFRSFPAYGDNDDYKEKFYNEFKEGVKNYTKSPISYNGV